MEIVEPEPLNVSPLDEKFQTVPVLVKVMVEFEISTARVVLTLDIKTDVVTVFSFVSKVPFWTLIPCVESPVTVKSSCSVIVPLGAAIVSPPPPRASVTPAEVSVYAVRPLNVKASLPELHVIPLARVREPKTSTPNDGFRVGEPVQVKVMLFPERGISHVIV